LGASTAPGSYAIEFTLFDRNGNASSTTATSLTLSASGGNDPLVIYNLDPVEANAGDIVTLYVGGFDDLYTNSALYRVTLEGIPAVPVDAASWYVTVRVPTNAFSGTFRLEAGDRVAYAGYPLTVPERIRLTPETSDAPQLAVNVKLQFSAELLARGQADLVWSVNGVTGGNATVGTISSNGLYRAPVAIPSGSNVTVSVRQAVNPAVSNSTIVAIAPPAPVPGRATILASIGGAAKSADGLAGAAIPPGALAGNVEVTARSLRGTNAPPNPPGQLMSGAAEFGPAGLTFSSPATITIPLVRHLDPGTALSLMLFNPTNSSFTDFGMIATVGL
jgi:hypothetical protein